MNNVIGDGTSNNADHLPKSQYGSSFTPIITHGLTLFLKAHANQLDRYVDPAVGLRISEYCVQNVHKDLSVRKLYLPRYPTVRGPRNRSGRRFSALEETLFICVLS